MIAYLKKKKTLFYPRKDQTTVLVVKLVFELAVDFQPALVAWRSRSPVCLCIGGKEKEKQLTLVLLFSCFH